MTVAPPRVDLHTHTTASDGVLSPAELVLEASRRGISVLGVTDHDTLDGLEEAENTATQVGIELIPGIELSTTVKVGEYHLLGYFVNRHDDRFFARLHELTDSRLCRVRLMLGKLADLGYRVDVDRVMAEGDTGSIGRPHVARELMRLGVVETVSEAFDRFLKSNRPAYVPREEFPPEDAIALMLANGAFRYWPIRFRLETPRRPLRGWYQLDCVESKSITQSIRPSNTGPSRLWPIDSGC